MSKGIIPIVNENDTIAVTVWLYTELGYAQLS